MLLCFVTIKTKYRDIKFRVLHEDVKNLAVAATQEAEHMGHIGVLARDGVGLHLVAVLVLVPAAIDAYLLLITIEIGEAVQVDKHIVTVGGDIVAVAVDEVQNHVAMLIQSLIVSPTAYDKTELPVIPQYIACEFLTVLIAGGVEVDKEVDDGCKEVLRGVLEESLASAFLFTTALVQRGKQCGCRLGGCRQVGNVLPLDGVHTIGVFHIGEVDDAETAVRGQLALLAVLAVLIEEVPCQSRELIVIDHHGKALGTVLADERVDDAEGLTGAGRSQDDGGTEGIDDVDPAVVQALLIVVDHRDIDTVLVLFLVPALLKALVLEIPFVVANLHTQIFGNGIEALVDKHRAGDGTEDIETAVEGITGKEAVEWHIIEDEAHDDHGCSGKDGIEHHRLEIPFQALACSRPDAGNGDTDEFHHLADSHGVEDLEAVKELKDKGDHAVVGGDGKVHHNLYNQYQIDARAEHAVHLLLFTGFFHSKGIIKDFRIRE